MSEDERRRVLRVIAGEPTPAELAALVAVVAGLRAGAAPAQGAGPAPSRWARNARASGLRRGLRPGPGAWRDAVGPAAW